jgi:SPP1 gp7 family putative phage head morphogenesis protein
MGREHDILDESLRHQVRVEGVAADVAKRVKHKLASIGSAALKRLSGEELTELLAEDIEAVLREIQADELRVMVDALDALTPQLEKLAAYEATYTAKALAAASEKVRILSLRAGEAYKAAMANPLAATGQMLEAVTSEWTERQAAKVSQLVGQGYANGWTNQQMAQAIRGTRALGYEDGLIEGIGKSADMVVRTAVQHVAGAARMETWAKNDDVLAGYRVLATLDSATCPACASIDNDEVYQTGEGPTPPFHIGCRCTTVPVLKEQYRYLAEGEERSSEDGPVDAKLTYYEWLKKQPTAFQDEALGPTRGQLMRDGGLSAKRFGQLNLGRDFRPMTLDEMRAKEPAAFKRAGL